MFKLLRLKAQAEIAQLKALHEVEMQKKESELKILEKELKKDHEIKLKEIVSLLKLESEQKTAQLKTDHQREINKLSADKDAAVTQIKSDLTKQYYDNLSAAMTKLHEEGNVTTKFTQDLALKMFEAAPHQKHTTKVLTGKTKDE